MKRRAVPPTFLTSSFKERKEERESGMPRFLYYFFYHFSWGGKKSGKEDSNPNEAADALLPVCLSEEKGRKGRGEEKNTADYMNKILTNITVFRLSGEEEEEGRKNDQAAEASAIRKLD